MAETPDYYRREAREFMSLAEGCEDRRLADELRMTAARFRAKAIELECQDDSAVVD